MTEATKATKPAIKKASHAEGYAVFETGGKQYRATVGEEVKIEKFEGENAVGDKIVIDKVLLSDDGKTTKIGDPYIAGATVEATVVAVGRAPKINVIKYKAKVNYFKKRGHRQPFLKVKIAKI
jgi:large subunit ribosomal protein L21